MIVLRKPQLTEKSLQLAKSGLYTFLIDKNARKGQIKSAIKQHLGVDVLSVKIANFKSKTKMQRTRKGFYEVAGYKKALVKIKKGQKIDLFEAETKKQVEVKTAETEPVIKEKRSLTRKTKVKIEKAGKK